MLSLKRQHQCYYHISSIRVAANEVVLSTQFRRISSGQFDWACTILYGQICKGCGLGYSRWLILYFWIYHCWAFFWAVKCQLNFRCWIYLTKICGHLYFKFWDINCQNGVKIYSPRQDFFLFLKILITGCIIANFVILNIGPWWIKCPFTT